MHLCPRCGGESRVLDSRPTDDNIRRRRICRACEHRWTTIEISLDVHILMLERETAIAKLLAKL